MRVNSHSAAALTYVVHASGEISVSLILSKSRIAPIKQLSIPRLELEAAVMSAKIDYVLNHELDLQLNSSFFWRDSQIALKYITNESRRFQTYVANRVSVIHSLSDLSQWHHIPSAENAADVVSRGGDIAADDSTWFTGPEFLHDYKSNWSRTEVDPSLENDPELKKVSVFAVSSETAPPTPPHPLDTLINYFSDLFFLKRAVACLFRVIRSWRAKERLSSHPLTVSEVKEATVSLLRHCQYQTYSSEISRLTTGSPVLKSSLIANLDPVLGDDGLLRVGGRLQRLAEVESYHPIVISHHSPPAPFSTVGIDCFGPFFVRRARS
jgi:hypothetical protein